MTPQLASRNIGDSVPNIYFCHGLLGRGTNLTRIANGLLPDSSCLLDLPNHGRSPWTTTFNYVEMADAVAAQISRDATEPVTLVGHSMGGKVVMLTALRHPTLISRVAVIDISPRTSDVTHRFQPLFDALLSLDLSSLTGRTDADQRLSEQIPDIATRAFLMQNLHRGPSGWSWQPNLALLNASLNQIGQWPTTDSAVFTGPTVWIRGKRSAYVQDDDLSTMRELFPSVRRITVEGAGHWVHADDPESVITVLRELLSEPV